MVRLYRAANLPEAHLLLHRLAQSGIDARVLNEHAQGAVGELPFTHAYPEVWLMDPRDEDRGREIVQQFERRAVKDGSLVCARCGEESPGGFELCWRCGGPLLAD